MAQLAKEILTITIEEELKKSYLDYAMSVIVGRALPDVRDGLKPVHRRVLYAMKELNNDYNKPYKKSARIVGDVIGKYHPHGDSAVYDTIVRMAQNFSLRYMLVDGQGNFGSVDGDSPAAMRYTEIRLSKIAHSLLVDLEKETVDFAPNYDGSEHAPIVLPTRVPNLLVNGSSGIAVGMATNIPPHNLSEILSAVEALIDNPDLEFADLLKLVPGPDFPTAGIINGRSGIISAYKTGRGSIKVRALTHIETNESTNRSKIIVTELPYQVNKARLLEKIGELVRDKKLDGVSGLRDESDKSGMRMVIEIKRADQPEVVLNNLFTQTQLQSSFGINMVALNQGRPQLMNIKQVLIAFIQHRREVVTRRTLFELKKARERAHILEGLGIALANIDEVIALIKAAKNPQEAKAQLLANSWSPGSVSDLLARSASQTRRDDLPENVGLNEGLYILSTDQAQAILDLRLHRLTGLEKDKIHNEYLQIIETIGELLKILNDPEELSRVIKVELSEIKDQFGDERRTEILESNIDISHEDLIEEEDLVVTLSQQGYIKSQSLDSYQAQRRGGRGKMATAVKEEDFVKNVLVANSHDTILCFSSVGKVYWMKTYKVPQGGRQSRGRPIINLLPLVKGESITAILPITEYDDKHCIFMATKRGVVKKVSLMEFERRRTSGKIAIELKDHDTLIGVGLTDGSRDVVLMASSGKAIRFNEKDVRSMGRTASGVRGMKISSEESVIELLIVDEAATLLTATENGYGQRTSWDDYRAIGRGGQGVRAIIVDDRNGPVVAAAQVKEDDELLMITSRGTMVRTRVKEISLIGRNTKGVRLLSVQTGERLVGIEPITLLTELETSEENA
jgi:DNA gyrase subunit A